jgi:flagellar hook-associated protein 3 FlgL
MRVTPTTMFLTVGNGLQRSIGRLQDAQEKLSSGKRINRLSDSPTDAATVLGLAARQRDWAAYTKAADDAVGWLDTQDQALQSASALLRRARELAISAGNGANSPGALDAIAGELTGLRDELGSLANTTYLGRSVFGGFAATAVSQDTTGAWRWAGGALDGSLKLNDAVTRRVAPEIEVRVNMDGSSVFGFATGGNDVFAVLDRLAADVRAGNTGAVTGPDLQALDARMSDVTDGLSVVGARTNQVESARDTGLARIDTLKAHRSSLEDADVAESVMDLQMAQSGYQAVLGATARLTMPSLVDFLR